MSPVLWTLVFALAFSPTNAEVHSFRASRQFALRDDAASAWASWTKQAPDAEAPAAKFPMTWVYGVAGVGILVGAAVGALLVMFMNKPKAEGEEGDEPTVEERAAGAMAATVAEVSPRAAPAEEEPMDYAAMMQMIMQKASAKAAPMIAKSESVREILTNTMQTFPQKAKSCVLSELNTVSAGLFAAVEAEEAVLVLDWNEAITTNLPPISVLLAGLASPSFLIGGASNNSTQVLFMLLPTACLCSWAIYEDWGIRCSIPGIKACVVSMAVLASLLCVVRSILSVKFATGMKQVQDKINEMEAKVQASRGEGGMSEARELFVAYAVCMQKAILEEQRVRHDICSVLGTVLTGFMIIVQVWNAVLVLGWTFVPGTVAFHVDAEGHTGGHWCGAWACVFSARVCCLLGVLFIGINVMMFLEGVSSLLVAFSSAYEQKVISIAKGIDKGMMNVPVCETLAKAFILRGSSETSRAQLAVTLQEQNNLKTKKAEVEARLKGVNASIARMEKECDHLTNRVASAPSGCDIQESMDNLESGKAFAGDIWKSSGDKAIQEAQKAAGEVVDANTEDLERLVEKVTETIDQLANSEMVKEARRQAEELAALAAEKAMETYQRLKDSGIMDDMLEKAKMGFAQIQDVAKSFADPEAAMAMLQNAQEVLNKQLGDSEAMQKALENVTKMANDLKDSPAGQAALEQIMKQKEALETAIEVGQAQALVAFQQIKDSPMMGEFLAQAEMNMKQVTDAAQHFKDPQAAMAMLQNAQDVINAKLADTQAVQDALDQINKMAADLKDSEVGKQAYEQVLAQQKVLEAAIEIGKEQAREAFLRAQAAAAEAGEKAKEFAAQAQMNLQQLNDAAEQFADPQAAMAMLNNAQDVINAKLADTQAVQDALDQVNKMAADLKDSEAGKQAYEQVLAQQKALEAALESGKTQAREAALLAEAAAVEAGEKAKQLAAEGIEEVKAQTAALSAPAEEEDAGAEGVSQGGGKKRASKKKGPKGSGQ